MGWPARDLLQFQHDLAMQEHASNIDVAGRVLDAHLALDQGQTNGAAEQ